MCLTTSHCCESNTKAAWSSLSTLPGTASGDARAQGLHIRCPTCTLPPLEGGGGLQQHTSDSAAASGGLELDGSALFPFAAFSDSCPAAAGDLLRPSAVNCGADTKRGRGKLGVWRTRTMDRCMKGGVDDMPPEHPEGSCVDTCNMHVEGVTKRRVQQLHL